MATHDVTATGLPESTRAERRTLAGLARRRERRESGLLLVEGPTLLREALDARLAPELVAVTAAARDAAGALLAEAERAGARLVALRDEDADRVSDTRHGTGLLAAVRAPRPWDARVPAAGDVLLPVAWGLQDPGNLGTLMRSARAFGAAGLLVSDGGADPTGPKALRASAGAAFHLRHARLDDADALRATAEESSLELVLAEPPRDGRGSDDPLPRRCLLVLGHETRGVPELPGVRTVTVPQAPGVESLNVGVAGSILMADWFRARDGGRAEDGS